ncbi:MAG: pyrimidine/purine nucleoside phosphorylase [bacterium]
MAITHNSYYEGRVQSLGFTDGNGKDATVGVLEPGIYKFGRAERREIIIVLHGTIFAKGQILAIHDTICFEVGEEVEVEVRETAAYGCVYF